MGGGGGADDFGRMVGRGGVDGRFVVTGAANAIPPEVDRAFMPWKGAMTVPTWIGVRFEERHSRSRGVAIDPPGSPALTPSGFRTNRTTW
jgi:hypothetical protein